MICGEFHRPERALTREGGMIPTPTTSLKAEVERPAIKGLRLG